MKQVILIAIPFKGEQPSNDEIRDALKPMLADFNIANANTRLSDPRVVVAEQVLN